MVVEDGESGFFIVIIISGPGFVGDYRGLVVPLQLEIIITGRNDT